MKNNVTAGGLSKIIDVTNTCVCHWIKDGGMPASRESDKRTYKINLRRARAWIRREFPRSEAHAQYVEKITKYLDVK